MSAYASTIGAQTTIDPIRLEIVSVDATGSVHDLPDDVTPAISDTGAVVAYETTTTTNNAAPNAGNPAESLDDRRVWIRDRDGGTSRSVAELGSTAPGISGNGCIVAYSVVGADAIELTIVDRCATPSDEPLPIGSVLDRVSRPDVPGNGRPDVAAPALSFDGSVVVWSSGQEIRRYVRPIVGATGAAASPPIKFDAVAGGRNDVVTGTRLDVSADGRDVVFVAGPGTEPYAPSPANIYVWTSPPSLLDSPPEPELLSATASGEPAALGDSESPTITADGTFVVFESNATDLAAVGSSTPAPPFVIGVDRAAGTVQILLDDATRPAVSADGNHIVYQRGDALRVLASDAATTVDLTIDELADARPTSPAAISQFGRWLVYAGTADLSADTTPAGSGATPVIWVADRRSSEGGTSDTTTSTTAPPTTPTTPTTPMTPTTLPSTVSTSTEPEVASSPTIPTTTLDPTVIVARFPTGFPSVAFTPPPRRTSTSSSTTFTPSSGSGSGFNGGATSTASASPVAFGPTVADVGRRTQPVTLSNATSPTVQITGVSIDVPEGFAVVSDSCTGVSIGPGSSCVVDVQFAPITVGPANGSVVFQLSDGSIVTASLTGEGVPGPTLDLLPAVAGAGQTVTVFGAGFPPGSTIGLNQPGVAVAVPVVVDANGTFAHVIVVLTNTPTGPAVVAVSGQPDTFDDVIAELLVSTSGAASGDIAVRSGPSSPLGR